MAARVSRPVGGVDYNCEALYQWGALDRTTSVHGLWLRIRVYGQGHRLEARLSLKADVRRGDKDPNNPDLQSFDPLFPKGAYFGETAS